MRGNLTASLGAFFRVKASPNNQFDCVLALQTASQILVILPAPSQSALPERTGDRAQGTVGWTLPPVPCPLECGVGVTHTPVCRGEQE